MTRGPLRHTLVILTGWIIYGSCQEDLILPLIASIVLAIPVIRHFKGLPPRDFLPRLPWPSVVILTILLGFVWRMIIPEPAQAYSLLPMVLGPLQSATILATLYVWLRPSHPRRSYYLGLLSWSTVALSVNIAFNTFTLSAFLYYCFLNMGLYFTDTFFRGPASRAKESAHSRSWKYLFAALFLVLSTGIFSTIVMGLRVADQTFMNLITDYILSLRNHHFLGLNSAIRLDGPGPNGRDLRPVLEIERVSWQSMYLKTQVYHEYNNGVWEPAPPLEPDALPNRIASADDSRELWMFKRLQNVIPAPGNIRAMFDHEAKFMKDPYGIITTDNKNRMRKIMFLPSETPLINTIPVDELTAIAEPLRKGLSVHTEKIVGTSRDPVRIARKIEQYFDTNFLYSLDVDFSADDAGLLRMLDEKRPAYCTYFASAMALMLREQNIPSRIVVGFLAQEPTRNGKFYLVRVKHAHAWTEALLPIGNGSGQQHWVRFDPTPSAALASTLDSIQSGNPLAEWFWLSLLRTRNSTVTMEKELLYGIMAGILLFILLMMNLKKILQGLRPPKSNKSHSQTMTKKERDRISQDIYRRFEEWIKSRTRMIPLTTETDTELIVRLREKQTLPPQTMTHIEQFIQQYHSVRFGAKDDSGLESRLNELEKFR